MTHGPGTITVKTYPGMYPDTVQVSFPAARVKPHRIGAGWIGLGVVSSGTVDGLSAPRRRSWRPARQD